MRIALIAPGELPIPATKGGAVETLATMLLDENDVEHRHDFTVFSYLDESAREQTKKYRYTSFVEMKNGGILEKAYNYLMRVRRIIEKKKHPVNLFRIHQCANYINQSGDYDLILVEGGIWHVVQLKTETSLPVILHHHTDMLYPGAFYPEDIYEHADLVIGVSQFVCDRVSSIDNLSRNKTACLLNAIDLELFQNVSVKDKGRQLRAHFHIGENEKVLLFCGRIDDTKGVKELVLACNKLRNNYKLVIVGKSWFSSDQLTPFEMEIREICKNISDKVIFTGYIPHDEIGKYYCMSDIFVSVSKCNDAAPLAIIEALASGNAIISTRVGGIPEYASKEVAILLENDDNLVEKLAEKIDELLSDEEKLQRMKQKAVQLSERHGKKEYYRSFCSIIQDFEG